MRNVSDAFNDEPILEPFKPMFDGLKMAHDLTETNEGETDIADFATPNQALWMFAHTFMDGMMHSFSFFLSVVYSVLSSPEIYAKVMRETTGNDGPYTYEEQMAVLFAMAEQVKERRNEIAATEAINGIRSTLSQVINTLAGKIKQKSDPLQ